MGALSLQPGVFVHGMWTNLNFFEKGLSGRFMQAATARGSDVSDYSHL